MTTDYSEGFTGLLSQAAQAHWPTERVAVIREARAASGGKWPAELTSGVMFYMGERITRAEFEAKGALE